MKVIDSESIGERGRNRTFNLLIKSQLLCQLSYAPDDWRPKDCGGTVERTALGCASPVLSALTPRTI